MKTFPCGRPWKKDTEPFGAAGLVLGRERPNHCLDHRVPLSVSSHVVKARPVLRRLGWASNGTCNHWSTSAPDTFFLAHFHVPSVPRGSLGRTYEPRHPAVFGRQRLRVLDEDRLLKAVTAQGGPVRGIVRGEDVVDLARDHSEIGGWDGRIDLGGGGEGSPVLQAAGSPCFWHLSTGTDHEALFNLPWDSWPTNVPMSLYNDLYQTTMV